MRQIVATYFEESTFLCHVHTESFPSVFTTDKMKLTFASDEDIRFCAETRFMLLFVETCLEV